MLVCFDMTSVVEKFPERLFQYTNSVYYLGNFAILCKAQNVISLV